MVVFEVGGVSKRWVLGSRRDEVCQGLIRIAFLSMNIDNMMIMIDALLIMVVLMPWVQSKIGK
jgi:hypothetical protein